MERKMNSRETWETGGENGQAIIAMLGALYAG